MRNTNSSLTVWDEAAEYADKSLRKRHTRSTKDMVHRRLRPEPEIIECILEDLEEKIRHYFNLFRLEKEKRENADKNNYYLQEEIAKAYETLEKSKMHTMKLEEKLYNIKENQSCLIDTVRRIDLLYVQLDTLVQSFAGVCTHTATDAVHNESNSQKKRYTLQMLLDYIYPCRTLDPRINTLYGLLHYQTIGLINGNYSGPPVPPTPPFVPSESSGWLPPAQFLYHDNIMHEGDIMHKNVVSSMDRTPDVTTQISSSSRNGYPRTSSDFSSRNSVSEGNTTSPELIGFDIKIGSVELNQYLENPKIICVVRYDNETTYESIQNSKRVTKPQSTFERSSNNTLHFKIDSTINLNSLPPKQPGVIPKFKIDIHDVRGKLLIGTAKCSFINEKTLIPNAPWNVYSRTNKEEASIIGKVYISVFAYPAKAKLPAETFRKMKKDFPFAGNDSSDLFSYPTFTSSENMSHAGSMKGNAYNNYSNVKSIMKPPLNNNGDISNRDVSSSPKSNNQKVVSFTDSKYVAENTPKSTPFSVEKPDVKNVSYKTKSKPKVTFKPYSPKTINKTGVENESKNDSTNASPNKVNLPTINTWKNASKIGSSTPLVKSDILSSTTSKSKGKVVETSKSASNESETEPKEKPMSNVQMLINKMAKTNNSKTGVHMINFKKNISTEKNAEKILEKSVEKISEKKPEKANAEKDNAEKNNAEKDNAEKDNAEKDNAEKDNVEKTNADKKFPEKKESDRLKVKLPQILKQDMKGKAVAKYAKTEDTLLTKSEDKSVNKSDNIKLQTSSTSKSGSDTTKTEKLNLSGPTPTKGDSNKNAAPSASPNSIHEQKKAQEIKSKIIPKNVLKSAPPTIFKVTPKSASKSVSKSVSKSDLTHSPLTSSTKTVGSDKISTTTGSKSKSNTSVVSSPKISASDNNDATDKKSSKSSVFSGMSIKTKKFPEADKEAQSKSLLLKKPLLDIKSKDVKKAAIETNISNSSELKKSAEAKGSKMKNPVSLLKNTLTKLSRISQNSKSVDSKTSDTKSSDTNLKNNTKSSEPKPTGSPATSKAADVNKKTFLGIKPPVAAKSKLGLLKSTTTSPAAGEPQKQAAGTNNKKELERVDSNDPKLKAALLNAQKKSIFIDKSKMKRPIIKLNEKPKFIKKFTPKFKAKAL